MPSLRTAVLLVLALAGNCAHAKGADEVERGRRLLAQYQCGTCHRIPGVAAARGDVAAPLNSWRHRSYIAGKLPNRGDLLQQWIMAPQSLVPGTTMPSMGVQPEDARAMASYLYSLE